MTPADDMFGTILTTYKGENKSHLSSMYLQLYKQAITNLKV